MATSACRTFLIEFKKHYDLIGRDCPPVLNIAETREIAVLAEGVVVVAMQGKTPAYALRTALSECARSARRCSGWR